MREEREEALKSTLAAALGQSEKRSLKTRDEGRERRGP
jgi:hypothetical protein